MMPMGGRGDFSLWFNGAPMVVPSVVQLGGAAKGIGIGYGRGHLAKRKRIAAAGMGMSIGRTFNILKATPVPKGDVEWCQFSPGYGASRVCRFIVVNAFRVIGSRGGLNVQPGKTCIGFAVAGARVIPSADPGFDTVERAARPTPIAEGTTAEALGFEWLTGVPSRFTSNPSFDLLDQGRTVPMAEESSVVELIYGLRWYQKGVCLLPQIAATYELEGMAGQRTQATRTNDSPLVKEPMELTGKGAEAVHTNALTFEAFGHEMAMPRPVQRPIALGPGLRGTIQPNGHNASRWPLFWPVSDIGYTGHQDGLLRLRVEEWDGAYAYPFKKMVRSYRPLFDLVNPTFRFNPEHPTDRISPDLLESFDLSHGRVDSTNIVTADPLDGGTRCNGGTEAGIDGLPVPIWTRQNGFNGATLPEWHNVAPYREHGAGWGDWGIEAREFALWVKLLGYGNSVRADYIAFDALMPHGPGNPWGVLTPEGEYLLVNPGIRYGSVVIAEDLTGFLAMDNKLEDVIDSPEAWGMPVWPGFAKAVGCRMDDLGMFMKAIESMTGYWEYSGNQRGIEAIQTVPWLHPRWIQVKPGRVTNQLPTFWPLDPGFVGFGFRGMIFYWEPLWDEKPSQSFTRNIIIQSGKSGRENRVGMETRKRLNLSYQWRTVDFRQNPSLAWFIAKGMHRTCWMPYWLRQAVLTAPMDREQVRAEQSVSDTEMFSAGKNAVIWEDWQRWEAVQILAVEEGKLVLQSRTAYDWPVGTMIMPLVFGRVETPEFKYETAVYANSNFHFKEI